MLCCILSKKIIHDHKIGLHGTSDLIEFAIKYSIATDKRYYSFDNERRLEAARVKDIYLFLGH